MNPKWSTWIVAAITKHFSGVEGLKYYVEGQKRASENETAYEIRIVGPSFTKLDGKNWRAITGMNIVVQCIHSDDDIYKMNRFCGLIAAKFVAIPVVDLDTKLQIGCMSLVNNRGSGDELIQITPFGVTEEASQIEESTVEGWFEFLVQES